MGFSGDRVQRPPERLGPPSLSHQNRQLRDGDRRDGAGRAGKNGCEARAVRRDRTAPRRPGPARAIAPILTGPGIFLVRRAHRPLRVRRAEWAVLRVPGPHQKMHRRRHRRPDLNRPGARGRRLLRRDVHFALENDGWNCPFESKVHISAGRRSGDRPHRANPGPRRTVAAVGPASRGFGQGRLFGGRWCGGGETEPAAGSWRRSPAWTTYVPLDHLRAVGPPYFVNQVVQRNISGPTAFKWSKQIGRVTTCETPSHHARRSAGWSKGGAPEPPPTSPSPPRFPAPSSPPPSTTLRITPGQRIQAPPNNLPGGEGLIRTGRHRNPHAPRLQNHPRTTFRGRRRRPRGSEF